MIHMEKFKAGLKEKDLPKVTETNLIQICRITEQAQSTAT